MISNDDKQPKTTFKSTKLKEKLHKLGKNSPLDISKRDQDMTWQYDMVSDIIPTTTYCDIFY